MKKTSFSIVCYVAVASIISSVVLTAPFPAFALTSATDFQNISGGMTPAPMTVVNKPNMISQSIQGDNNTSTQQVNLNTTDGCSNDAAVGSSDYNYSSYANGTTKVINGITQLTAGAQTSYDTIGFIYVRANPIFGASSNWTVGFMKGNGSIIEGSGVINSTLQPLLTAITNIAGAGGWKFRITTFNQPAQYNVSCSYTRPTLTPVAY